MTERPILFSEETEASPSNGPKGCFRPGIPRPWRQNEKPILMSAPMVKAILDGRKSMTRRVVKPFQPVRVKNGVPYIHQTYDHDIPCPYGQAGDQLWLRETFSIVKEDGSDKAMYRADTPEITSEELQDIGASNWKPSIFMPRKFSRITLEITNVRVERLQEITKEDCLKEGVRAELVKDIFFPAYHNFMRLWESINGKKYPWSSNPFVWVISFRRVI